MKNEHTPGDWHIGMCAQDRAIYGPKGEQIAVLPAMLLEGEVLANLRLIRAAPRLLAALQRTTDHLVMGQGVFLCEGQVRQSSDWKDALAAARAAIDLATRPL